MSAQPISERYREVIDDVIRSSERWTAVDAGIRELEKIPAGDLPAGPIRDAHRALIDRHRSGVAPGPTASTLGQLGDFMAAAMCVEYMLREYEDGRSGVRYAERKRASARAHRTRRRRVSSPKTE